ncbi:hypothetical protein [Haloferula sp. A504]|uniref:hypothetical protein n=1 Tax=Haloferula sp. A504 TaxID=3373601 RepID=UPI0031C30A20|nr:hypothetical protein [Verrucomicrobiaceae bacterium E54]
MPDIRQFEGWHNSGIVWMDVIRILPVPPIPPNMSGMQAITEKKLAAFEKKLGELGILSQEIKRLDRQVMELRERIDAPKDWSLMAGRLRDTRIAREADAMGRDIRRKQAKP